MNDVEIEVANLYLGLTQKIAHVLAQTLVEERLWWKLPQSVKDTGRPDIAELYKIHKWTLARFGLPNLIVKEVMYYSVKMAYEEYISYVERGDVYIKSNFGSGSQIHPSIIIGGDVKKLATIIRASDHEVAATIRRYQ